MSYKIAIGGDHAGYEMKKTVVGVLQEAGHEIKDYGPYDLESVDYPDYIHPVAAAVQHGDFDFGIAICGSGNGVSMVANKYQGIRAAICWEPALARLGRTHNDANILCLPARFISPEKAMEIVDIFLKEPFEGGRHKRRVDKIDQE